MFNDEEIVSGESLEGMARAYTESLKAKGFYFIKIDSDSEIEITVSEIEMALGKLILVYQANRSEKARVMLGQLFKIKEYIHKNFEFKEVTKYKRLARVEDIIGIESNLLLKLFYLSDISHKKEPRGLALSRLELFKELFFVL